MKIIFKHGDGLVITDIENPKSDYLIWNQDFQNKIDNYVIPIINENYTDIVESATKEEIEAAKKEIVPISISRMGLKIQLLLKRITITDIVDTINAIPDYMFPEQQKQIAIIKFEDAAYFDRYNADLQLVATLMGLSQEDLDDIFINGNKI